MVDDEVSVVLSTAQALVLFDWLARSSEAGAPVGALSDAEQRVFWDLEAILESTLSEPLAAGYSELHSEASRRVLGQ
ncbi:hypothetical protein [uncultured Jatrophihabitans sp.]|uniref:hypothetical protein n=1 Tax=uncultured Jatrophihabitans sp. TaxID=1610747 RepID=UPI0035C9D03B